MKIRFTLLLLFLLQFPLNYLGAQSMQNGNSGLPLKSNKSILFGYDTFINNQPLQNQRNIVICSAFNGWLYGAYNYFDASVQYDETVVLRSKDNGISWTVLNEWPFIFNPGGISKMDILACGNDTSNLKVFIGSSFFDSTTSNHTIGVVRYNRNIEPEDAIFTEYEGNIKDFALASDYPNPASNSNPFSLALIYSKEWISKSINFYSSSDGGMSFDSHYEIVSPSLSVHKVALDYGYCPSWSSGRYFVAWEEQENENSVSGHIYTAHSEPDFNSPFTTPMLLDSLDATAANMASNPVIACQNNAADNDSSNLTEVVLFEKYVPTTHKFNIDGLCNKRATVSNNFQKFTIDASANNKIQPDICFNAFDSTFIVTYFDSTTQKLPYYVHDLNMTDPDAWVGLSAGYNDNNNLVKPHPQVVMDFGKQMGANVWISEGGGGNGAAMFDSPYTYYTGSSEKNMERDKLTLKIFPNPASEFAILEFELPRTENVKVDLLSLMGQSLTNITYPSCTSGKHQVKIDLTNYSSGMYILTIHAENSFSSGKISVTR